MRKVVQQILCHGIVLPLGGNVSNDSEVTMAMYPYFLTMLRKEGAFYRRKVGPTLTFKMFRNICLVVWNKHFIEALLSWCSAGGSLKDAHGCTVIIEHMYAPCNFYFA